MTPSTNPLPIRCQPRVRPYPGHPLVLRRQIAAARAEIVYLKSEIATLQLKPHAGLKDAVSLRALIQKLTKPSEAAPLIAGTNGPTVYWLCAQQFLVDRTIAQNIVRETGRDWKAAVVALDQHAF